MKNEWNAPRNAEITPRDRALGALLRESLAGHPRIRATRVSAVVKGGVAHITGKTASTDEAALIRRVAARQRGILGVWDTLELAGRKTVILDLGCGAKKQTDRAIGVDRFLHEGIAVCADLEQPLPFKTSAADYIFAVHCLEHLHNLVPAMNEIHRVLAPGGAAHIMVPQAACVNAAADPTHVRYFNPQTFKYFCLRRPGIAPFRPIQVTGTADTVFADLIPVKQGDAPATEEELSLYFNW